MKRNLILILGMAAVLCLAANAAWALTTISQANGDWSTAGTWNNGEPTATDTADVKNGYTVTITQPGEVANILQLTTPAGTLTMSSGGLTVGTAVYNYYGTMNLNGGGLTNAGILFINNGIAANPVVNIGGGNHTSQRVLLVATTSGQTATYNQTAGSMTFGNDSNTSQWEFRLYSPYATANLTGGDLIANVLYASRIVQVNGQFNLGDANGTANIRESATTGGFGTGRHLELKVQTNGVFRGWGTVIPTLATYGGTHVYNPFSNDGKVIADGYGTDRTLSFPNFTSDKGGVTNPVENTTDKGWYAQNHGKLTLANLDVSSGTPAVTWGETISDTTPDLVNSFCASFSGVSGSGTLSGSLLAVDRTDVPGGLLGTGQFTNSVIGVWEITTNGLGFSSASLLFRYDSVRAAALGLPEDDLRLYQFNTVSNSWDDITLGMADTINHRLTSQPITSLSLFAIGVIPEPTAAVLLGLGGLVLLRRQIRF